MSLGAIGMVNWPMIDTRRFSAGRLALTIIAFLLYAIAFIFYYPRMGSGVAALAGLPVLIGSWLLGLTGGILSAVFSIFLIAALLTLHGEPGLDVVLGGGGTAGSLTALALGLGVGYARTLHDRYLQEIAARREAEAALRRNEQALQQRNRELQLLNRVIAAAASSKPDPRAVLQTVCREMARAFDVPQAGAALLADSGTTLEVVAEYTMEETVSAVGERIAIADNSAAQAVLREKRPLTFDGVQEDASLGPALDLVRRRNVASMMLLPLQIDGEVVGTIGLDTAKRRDFTEEETQLAMTAASAAGQVLERARLHEAAQAQERLAAVGQLSAGIAHDFNNILGVIIIYAEMLQQLSLPAPVVQRVDVIHQQAKRASQLVQQILDFSRKTVMRRQTIDLQVFLQEQVRLLERMLQESIEIDVECAEGFSYRVEGDATRLQQAVMNLAVNAQDAMPEGGQLQFALSRLSPGAKPPTLELEAEWVRSEDWILLEVYDCGSGIEAEHLGHIFEPFYTTKAPGKGSGLGLAQVYGIVKQHQGHIEATSEAGQGTTFKIYLPMLEEAPATVAPTDERPASEVEETVLVVEDNEIMREALMEILKTFGYKVFEAEDGQEAIGLFKAHREEIGLVISDMVMPRMGGRALYQALRALNPDVCMVFTSGYPLDEENRRFVEESGSVWVNKPFSHDMLAKAIERVLEAGPVQASV